MNVHFPESCPDRSVSETGAGKLKNSSVVQVLNDKKSG